MNMQELATLATYGIPVKVVIMNNGFLGMVRQWQELFWDRRYSRSRWASGPTSSSSPRRWAATACG